MQADRTVEPELSSGNSVSRGWKEVVQAWTLLSESRGKRRVTCPRSKTVELLLRVSRMARPLMRQYSILGEKLTFWKHTIQH